LLPLVAHSRQLSRRHCTALSIRACPSSRQTAPRVGQVLRSSHSKPQSSNRRGLSLQWSAQAERLIHSISSATSTGTDAIVASGRVRTALMASRVHARALGRRRNYGSVI